MTPHQKERREELWANVNRWTDRALAYGCAVAGVVFSRPWIAWMAGETHPTLEPQSWLGYVLSILAGLGVATLQEAGSDHPGKRKPRNRTRRYITMFFVGTGFQSVLGGLGP